MRDIGRPVTREEVQPYTTQLNGVHRKRWWRNHLQDGGYTARGLLRIFIIIIDGVTEMRADLTAEDEGKVLTTLLQQFQLDQPKQNTEQLVSKWFMNKMAQLRVAGLVMHETLKPLNLPLNRRIV